MTSSAKQILCISFSPIERDARVLRQIHLLSELGEVTTVGFGETPVGATRHVQVPDGLTTLPQTLLGVAKLAVHAHKAAECSSPAAQWALAHAALLNAPEGGWDLVVANDARVLDLGFRLAGTAPVWADLHEWAPEERTHITSWRLLVAPFMVHLCQTYLHRATLVTTVSHGIVELYRERFGVDATLMTNAGPYMELPVQASRDDRIRCVHSGAAIGGRGLETMIRAFRKLPERFSLDLYLVSAADGGAHLAELRAIAEGVDRIRFHDPVRPDELPATLSAYDLGIFWIPPTHTNARLTLPNKFFDYVQARIGMAIGPSEEMVRELENYGLGIVSKSFDMNDLVASMESLTVEQVNRYKHAAAAAALPLSFDVQTAFVRGALEDVLAD
ncbi:hypothetical protein [Salinibacterium sp. NG253]|uniref:hypothetical protein n=1 Tax=Salinibacterium sp. NG253 TaxID=2792039 RepID=UPI0027DE87C9|nr:hypothetical protein [Salinibacterium sp. NG253]